MNRSTACDRAPRSWAEVKLAVAAAGVKDSDPIWLLDLGPGRGKLVIDRDETGVEISDDCAGLMGDA